MLSTIVLGCGSGPSATIASSAAGASQGGAPSPSSSPQPSPSPSSSQPSSSPSSSPSPPSPQPSPSPSRSPSPQPFVLTSPAFADGAAIPAHYTCDGPGPSPELRWSGVPEGTAALLLEVIDVDAHDFVHWLVLDLPAETSGALPSGVTPTAASPQQGRNSFGQVGWGGPCPPSGSHHYVFTLFALVSPLGLAGHPERAAVDRASGATRVLGTAVLTGTYRRR